MISTLSACMYMTDVGIKFERGGCWDNKVIGLARVAAWAVGRGSCVHCERLYIYVIN